MPRLRFLRAIACSVLLAATAAAAPLPAQLTDVNLDSREVGVLSLANGRLRVVDADRNVEEVSLRSVVRIRFSDTAEADASLGRLTLVDGQVLTGQLAADGPWSEERLAWSCPPLGTVRGIPLERIAGLTLPGHAPSAASSPPAADELRLANGDALAGFVAAVSPQGVSLEPEAGGPAATIAWDAIAGLRLANPAAALPAGDLLRLPGGTRVAASSVRFDGESWTFELAEASPLRLPAAAVAAVQPAASGLRLLDLATVSPEEAAPAEAFGLPFPVRVTPAGVEAHAPTELLFSAPGDAAVRRVRVRLSLSPEAAASPLASVDASLAGGDPVRLDAKNPTAELTGDAPEAPLRLVLTEAEHGPVLDRVRIEAIDLLVEVAGE